MTPRSLPVLALEDVCVRVTDGTHQSPRFERHGVPFLVISDVVSGKIIWEGVSRWVSEETYEAHTSRCRPERGDVLYTAVGSFGVAVPVETDQRFMFQRHIAHIKPDRVRIDTRYLAHVLNSPDIRRSAERVAKGVAQRTVTLADLKKFEIPVPPLPEQRRIADILDKADAIRRKRQNAIAFTEELLRSAFLDMFGDPVTNSKGWPEVVLGDLAQVVSGVTKGKDFNGRPTVARPYMRVANVQDDFIDLEDVRKIDVLETDAEKYQLEPGDVLLTEGGDPDKLGRGAVWHGEVENCIHQNHVFRVRADRSKVLPEYLSAIIGSARGKRYFLKAAKQTTGIATINKRQLNAFPVLVPPLAVQREYIRRLGSIRTLGKRLRLAADSANELFDSLVGRAFRGELRC